MIDVKDCVGKKVIASMLTSYCTTVQPDYFEIDVLELSPSEIFIKIKIKDEKKWEKVNNFKGGYLGYLIEEILGDIPKRHKFK